MTAPLPDLLATPDCYLHSFEGEEAILVPMNGAAYRRSIFLDHRISTAAPGGWRVPAETLTAGIPATSSMAWIFHIAHCGSTLLARALDSLDGGLVLREPLALRQIALAADTELLAPVLALLSRRYAGDGPTLIKANVPVNFILPDIVVADPRAAALFLWSHLEDYLLAILRSPTHRNWVRTVSALLASRLGDPGDSSDAELAAALWIAQHRYFADALDRLPAARSLQAETFFARPGPALAASAACLGRSASADEIEAVIGGPLFATYSKNPAVAFNNEDRLTLRAEHRRELESELVAAQRWIDRNAPDAPAVLERISGRTLID